MAIRGKDTLFTENGIVKKPVFWKGVSLCGKMVKGFMRDSFEKLNQLLEQDQCELTGIPDGFF